MSQSLAPYAAFPGLSELPIAELTHYLRRTTQRALQEGMDPDTLLAELPLVVEREQYELAQVILEEVSAFRREPQLSLFQRIFS